MADVAVIIPARYESSRFPGKPLAKILGIPLIIRVANICALAVGEDNVYVATDDSRIREACIECGYAVVMTSNSCLTGTDRVAEASRRIDADIFINVQGDEPMLNPADIVKAIEAKRRTDAVITCMSDLGPNENPSDTKIPKIVVDENNKLLYASRSAIPGSKSGITLNAKKQVCIYGFTKNQLELFLDKGEKTPLEQSEDLEILRFLEMGVPVQIVEVSSSTHAVDFPEDINIVEELLSTKNKS